MGTSAPKLRGYPFEELDGVITPTRKWFLRSHLEIPHLDASRHRVQIGGWVERPYSLTVAELQRMP
jgi:sulfane dehydrogenase subunit SoxC